MNFCKPYLAVILFFAPLFVLQAQIIKNNGAAISISSGTVINSDSIINNSGSTLTNHGTTNLISLINVGIINGDGYYNISNIFLNTGTFNSGTSTVNFNGVAAQNIPSINYFNLTTSNSRGSNNITFSNSSTIGIAGSFSANASFSSGRNIITGTHFNFNGSGAQTVPSFAYEKLSFSGGNTKTLSSDLIVTDYLDIANNTTLALGNYNVTLPSNATSTARVATSSNTAAITYGTGRFVAERYVPGRRKFRLLTSPVTTSELTTLSAGQENLSIWGNWQNAGSNATANVGTIITGGTVGDGYDQQTTTPSVFNYDATGHRYVSHSSLYGKNTKYTPLKAGKAYYFFVYGDRLNSISANSPNYTTLKARGKILLGDQVYTKNSTMPLTSIIGDYTFLGNPFASPIDWSTLPKTDIEDTYWGWDPNLSSTGGYITVNSSGGVTLISPFSGTVGLNQYIQSGQGFFVRTSASNPSLSIREIDKVSNYNVNAFRGPFTTSLIAINLLYYDGTKNILADGTLEAVDDVFNNSKGKEDATKFFNTQEGICINDNNDLLSINGKKNLDNNDSIQLNLFRLKKSNYTFEIFTQNFESQNVQPYLQDNYLNTLQALSIADTNLISFNVNQDIAASFGINRFKIVFKNSKNIGGLVENIYATKKDRTIQVDYVVVNDKNIKNYELQRSDDGINFSSYINIASKENDNLQAYQYIDEKPIIGKNYYRVKSVYKTGLQLLSKIAMAEMDKLISSISVYPNPIIGKTFNLTLKNIEAGNYFLNLYDAAGKLIEKQSITLEATKMNMPINLNNNLSGGNYFVRLENGNVGYTTSIIVK